MASPLGCAIARLSAASCRNSVAASLPARRPPAPRSAQGEPRCSSAVSVGFLDPARARNVERRQITLQPGWAIAPIRSSPSTRASSTPVQRRQSHLNAVRHLRPALGRRSRRGVGRGLPLIPGRCQFLDCGIQHSFGLGGAFVCIFEQMRQIASTAYCCAALYDPGRLLRPLVVFAPRRRPSPRPWWACPRRHSASNSRWRASPTRPLPCICPRSIGAYCRGGCHCRSRSRSPADQPRMARSVVTVFGQVLEMLFQQLDRIWPAVQPRRRGLPGPGHRSPSGARRPPWIVQARRWPLPVRARRRPRNSFVPARWPRRRSPVRRFVVLAGGMRLAHGTIECGERSSGCPHDKSPRPPGPSTPTSVVPGLAAICSANKLSPRHRQ